MRHKITTLANGLTIVSDTMAEVESVSLNICVKVGSRYEDASICGISHFLEHMAFKGTKRRTAQKIAEEFDAIGGYFNAYTGREHTVYTTKFLKEDLSTAIDILSDILQHSVFSEEELARELDVILQEIAQTNDTPDDIVFDHFQNHAFQNQAIGRSILGTEEIIRGFTPDTLRKYVANFYHANNIIVSAAGNIDHNQLVELIAKYFDSLPANSAISFASAKYDGGWHYQEKDLEQVHLVLGFNGLPFAHPDFYAANMLAIILGGGMSSRLFQEVREKRGLAYSVGAFSSSYSDAGIFGVYAGTAPEDLAEMCEVMQAELRKIFDHNVTTDELTRAKSQLRTSILMGQESTSYRAEELGRNMMIYGRHIAIDEIMAKLNVIDAAYIKRVAVATLDGSKPTVSAIGRLSQMPSYEKISGAF